MTSKPRTFRTQVLAYGQIVVWVAAFVFAVWTMATGFGQIVGAIEANGTQITSNRTQLDDHEQRLRIVEQDMREVVTDVRWIRQTLEKEKDQRTR